MYYELYVDSLFLINFVMNLYLLLLVNKSFMRTATRLRLVLGAGVGAGMYLIPFLSKGPIWCKLSIGFLVGNLLMIWISFRIRNLTALVKIFIRLLGYSFLLGGALSVIIRLWLRFTGQTAGILTILGIGAISCLIMDYFREREKQTGYICRATLIREDQRVSVEALIDSGNGLIEPISGKAVSVIDGQLFEELWKGEEPFSRVIPYHSIGKKRGIMQGYLLPELLLEIDGVMIVRKGIYVAVSEEEIGGNENAGKVRMIVNPLLLQKG